MRNAFRSVSIAMTAIGILSCSESIDSTRPSGHLARLSLAPQFDQTARLAAAQLATVGINFDRVRVIIVRPQTDTLADTTIAFHPGDDPLTLELAVLATPNDTLTATVQYATATAVLFQGSAPAVAVPANAAPTTTNTVAITVKYTGPGATVTKVAVSPGSGTYSAISSTQFSATATDANNAQVGNAPVAWSVSDTTLATIGAATGVLSPKGSRGTVTVMATAGTVFDSVNVTLAPATSRLRVVQGAAQAAPPGSALPLPVIIEAVAADGLPSGAVGTVTFSANGGGSISPTTVALDANGRAQAVVTLGASAGGVFLYTATVGAFSVTFPEIAVVGPPSQFIATGSTTITMTAGVAPTPLPTFRIADALGNSVPNTPIKATITLLTAPGGTTVTPPFVVDTIGTGNLSAIATQMTVAGSYTVKFETIANSAVNLTYNITVNPAAATKVVFIQGPSNVTAGAAMSPAVTVAIEDTFGNVVTSSTASVTIAIDPSSPTGVTTTGSTLTVTAVSGIATFSNLKFSPSGKTGVKLNASSAGLGAAISSLFNIL